MHEEGQLSGELRARSGKMNSRRDETPGLFGDAFDQDPHAYWRSLQKHADVVWSEALDAWLILSFSRALEVLKDRRFLTDVYSQFRPSPLPVRSSFEMPSEENAKLRRLVGRELRFTREDSSQVLNALEKVLRRVDRDEDWDLLGQLARPLSLQLVRDWLGLSRGSEADLLHLFQRVHDQDTPGFAVAAGEVATEILLEEIRAARRSAESSLLARLARAWPSIGGRDPDLAAFVSPMIYSLVKGIGTQLLGHAVVALCQSSDVQEAVRSGGARMARLAAEEAARWEPVQQAIPRRAGEDVTLAGRSIAEGERVLLVLTAICRDPVHHPQPDAYRLLREERSLAFGYGAHGCLGGAYATAVTAVALAGLLRSGPLRLAVGDRSVSWDIGMGLTLRRASVHQDCHA